MNFIPYPVNCVMQILLKHYTNPHYKRTPCTYFYTFWPFLCEQHWYPWLILRCFLCFLCYFECGFLLFFAIAFILNYNWIYNELCCLANRNKKPWNVCYLSMWYQFIHYQFGQFRQYTVKDNKVELFWKMQKLYFYLETFILVANDW